MADKKLTNGVDESTLMHFIREENSLRAQISALQGKRKNFRSGVKSFGIKLRNFDRVIEQFNAQDGGQEAIEDLREQQRLAQMADIPFGYQFTFNDELKKQGDSPKGGAKEQGRRAYLALVKESENPFPANTPQGQDWLNGFREAESMVKAGKERSMSPPPPKSKAAEKKEADDDGADDEKPPKGKRTAADPAARRATKPARKSRGK